MNTHHPARPLAGPGELVEIMPFHLRFRPENSMVVHNTLGPTYIDGPTMTLPFADDPDSWPDWAEAFGHTVSETMSRSGHPMNAITVFLYRDPLPGHTDDHTAALLRPAAEQLAATLASHGAVILETIGIVNDHWWAYRGPHPHCCEGQPLTPDDPQSLTAQLIQLGQTPGRRTSDIASEFRPTTTNATRYREALDAVAADLHEQTQTRLGQSLTREGTGRILDGALKDLRNGSVPLDDEIAARIILGLQDTRARDHAIITYSEDDDLPHARSLFAQLARRCVAPHTDKAPPLLTLVGWFAWRQHDDITARIAFQDALAIDADCRMARVLYNALADGVDPQDLMEVHRELNTEPLADDESDTTS